ncbi:MAG: flavin reductase family protein [Nocardioidaceae bacterium]
MTIHNEHPFLPPESERDPVRRLQGRLGGSVTLWTAESAAGERAGLTVSSLLVAAGDPAHVLGLLDPESKFVEVLHETGVAVVQLLQWQHRNLADAFAGQFPAPGGAFKLADWDATPYGPVLTDAAAWTSVRWVQASAHMVGWSLLVDCVVERVEIRDESAPLIHRRGRYQRPLVSEG